MLSIDEFVKLLLAFSIAFALVVIAWGIFRMLMAITGTIQDVRHTIGNVNKVSDMAVEDYSKLRKLLGAFDTLKQFVSGRLFSFWPKGKNDDKAQE